MRRALLSMWNARMEDRAMRVRRLKIRNFRGIKRGVIDFPKHALLVGGNNVGKSTICEALDLVLGPERMWRRPVVDEHDFYCGHYMPEVALAEASVDGAEAAPQTAADATHTQLTVEPGGGADPADVDSSDPSIQIDVVLTDLGEEAERRFAGSLRRWDEAKAIFVDEDEDVQPENADAQGVLWALPVGFIGRYNREEDDFEGGTFLLHPVSHVDDADEERLGAGLQLFTREHKRFCGFVFLRALRTGSRALTLQKGSLFDTVLRLHGEKTAEMWVETLAALRDLDPGIGKIPQLQLIQSEIQKRARQFVGLSESAEATAFFASDLTRADLRDFVRLFVAAKDPDYLLPFQRHGTGTVNVLVFALLTFIAELKTRSSVIFAMEEPEIALPPHTQRRISRFVLKEMGQAIVTSHSPYVIEQFESSDIVVLARGEDGKLVGKPLDPAYITEKMFRTQRRQFAEGILGPAVLVVEGSTELQVMHAVSTALETFAEPDYIHIDLAGVTVFDAGSDSQVPTYGPVFAAMDKIALAFVDKPKKPWPRESRAKLARYTHFKEHEFSGIEDLLVAEVPEAVQRSFLQQAANRDDYPKVGKYEPGLNNEEVAILLREVLKARKGDNYSYAGLLIECCETRADLPATIVDELLRLNEALFPPETMEEEVAAGDPCKAEAAVEELT